MRCFAGIHLAARTTDRKNMVRGTGLEPVSSRWQRNILAARRSQHFGADGESRTRVIGLEAQGTSRYTTPARALTL